MRNPRNRLRLLSRLGALSLASVTLLAGVAVAPAAVAAPAAGSAAPTRPAAQLEFVALGDSFTSGQGAPPYSDSTCLTSRAKSYPVISSVLSPYSLTENKACSGATVADVAGQLAGIDPATKLVTLTVGGIDAGSNTVMAACAGYPADPGGACALAIQASRQQTLALLGTLPVLYGTIAATLPNARIAVLNYPMLFEAGVSPLGDLFNQGTVGLNDVIRYSAALAGSSRISYVDATQEFAGHGIGSAVPYIAFDPANPAAPANFHPNALGDSRGYYRALINDGMLARP